MLRFIAIYSPDRVGDWTSLLEIAQTISPRVEIWAPRGFLLETSVRYEQDTLHRLRQITRKKSHLHIGIASTRITAFFAAQSAHGTLIPPGKEREFLAPLPIDLLFLHPMLRPSLPHEFQLHSALAAFPRLQLILKELFATVARWGIRTLGELVALPESELVARLGQEAVALQKIARGEDITPFQAYLPERRFELIQELEWALDSLEPLAFILGGLLERLCSDLQNYGLAADSLEVTLKLAHHAPYEHTLSLPFPTHNSKLLLSLLRLDLQSHPPQAGILGVTLQAQPARPRVVQYSLLQPPSPHPEKLSQTLKRLTTLVGENNVGSPILLNTYRPDAFQLAPLVEQKSKRLVTGHRSLVSGSGSGSGSGQPVSRSAGPLSLRRIRPPVSIRIRPSQIAASTGPWRSSGDWWAEGWSHDEWDIELVDGAVYRIYRDHHEKAWFLEGIYD